MLNVVDGECVQWQDGEQGHVGKVQRCAGSRVWLTAANISVLVRAEPSGRLVFVDSNCLKPYPSEPIEEPELCGSGRCRDKAKGNER